MGIRSQGNPVISYKSVWENTAKGATDPPPPPYPEGTGTWIGNRGIYGGGYVPAGATNVIAYIDITSTGNASDFGDLTTARHAATPASNGTRGVIASGYESIASIDYITIASTGNAQDFGDLTVARLYDPAGAATSTRGVFAGGQNQNVIDYITIASTGNATDFGDLRGVASQKIGGHCSDEAAVQNEAGFPPSAMGLFAGGYTNLASGGSQSTVEYIDIATTGNSIIFGDLIEKSESFDGVASSTRAVFGAHYLRSGNSKSNIIEHLTFSTKGKATDFGD